MRASLALAIAAGAALLLWRMNARAAQVDNPDPVSISDFVPSFDFGESLNMQLSQNGLDRIKAREGFSAYSYPDADGRSIGYGHFLKPGEEYPEPITEADAENILANDVYGAVKAVNSAVTVPLTQSQFDALVSLAFNIGENNFHGSTLVRKLNAGDYAGALAEFGRWNKSQGQTLASLTSRRADEATQFSA